MERHRTQNKKARPKPTRELRLVVEGSRADKLATTRDADVLSAKEAARRLGVSVTTFYDWLGRSKHGLLIIHGQRVTINYMQTGACGQGRILLEVAEVERLKDALRVRSQKVAVRRHPTQNLGFPGITVPLGRPTA